MVAPSGGAGALTSLGNPNLFPWFRIIAEDSAPGTRSSVAGVVPCTFSPFPAADGRPSGTAPLHDFLGMHPQEAPKPSGAILNEPAPAPGVRTGRPQIFVCGVL